MVEDYITLVLRSDDSELQSILSEALCENYYESPEGYAIEEDSNHRGTPETVSIIVSGIGAVASLLKIAEILGLVDFIKDKISKKISLKKIQGKNIKYKRIQKNGDLTEITLEEGIIEF